MLRAWLTERAGAPGDPLFPATTGSTLSRDAIERRLAPPSPQPRETCPSLADQARHHAHAAAHRAMRLLQAGNDITVIALWLGHEQISTTNIYLHADMTTSSRQSTRPGRPPPRPAATSPPTRSPRSWNPSIMPMIMPT